MKFAHAVISSLGFEDPTFNPLRLALLEELVASIRQQDAELLALPAGFLAAESEEEVDEQIATVACVAEQRGIAIVGGVDVKGFSKKFRDFDEDRLTSYGELPYFGFAVGYEGECWKRWRQTSTTSENANQVARADVPGANRLVTIGGRRVGILICGELFSESARARIGKLAPDLIVDLGHMSMGQGLIPAMKSIVKACANRCAVAHSQHLDDWKNRAIHYVDARCKQASEPVSLGSLVQYQKLWAGWALRKL